MVKFMTCNCGKPNIVNDSPVKNKNPLRVSAIKLPWPEGRRLVEESLQALLSENICPEQDRDGRDEPAKDREH